MLITLSFSLSSGTEFPGVRVETYTLPLKNEAVKTYCNNVRMETCEKELECRFFFFFLNKSA